MKEIIELSRKSFISNFTHLSFPMKVSLLLTFRCNAKCVMCNIWKKNDHSDELSPDELQRFFSKSNNISWMDLSGGEIFLRDDILDIIKIIFSHCKNLFLLHFATNGFMVDKTVSLTEKILRYNPPKLLVTVSLDGDKETHERIRGVSGVFEKTLSTFSALRKYNNKKFKVFLGMTLSDANATCFQNTFDSVREVIPDLSLDDFHFNLVQASSHYYDNLGTNSADHEEILKTIKKYNKDKDSSLFNPVDYLERRYQELVDKFVKTQKCPLPCQALSNSCFIGPNGDIYPCSMYDKIVGNIKDFDYDLKKAWSSLEVKKTRQEIQHGHCPHCWTPCEAYQTIIGNFFKLRQRHI